MLSPTAGAADGAASDCADISAGASAGPWVSPTADHAILDAGAGASDIASIAYGKTAIET